MSISYSPPVSHRTLELDGMKVFYREAGPEDAPVLLLPHGYPCSSHEFRQFMPALGDRWRLISPDFPGFGYSDTPEGFDYSFDGYTDFLDKFVQALELERFALYLHDYGSQIGLRLAIKAPERVTALIIQNGDIYEDVLGPKYEGIKAYWADPSPKNRQKLEEAVSEEGFKAEFLGEIDPALHPLLSPDLWRLHWSLMTPKREEIMVGLMAGLKANLDWFPRYQAYLREQQPPTLIVWGPQDGYMPAASGLAYRRDLPDAEIHMLKGGHWLLETHLEEVVSFTRDFLSRTLPTP